jgi:hypothetical protein
MCWHVSLLLVAAVELACRPALASVRDHLQLRQIIQRDSFPDKVALMAPCRSALMIRNHSLPKIQALEIGVLRPQAREIVLLIENSARRVHSLETLWGSREVGKQILCGGLLKP